VICALTGFRGSRGFPPGRDFFRIRAGVFGGAATFLRSCTQATADILARMRIALVLAVAGLCGGCSIAPPQIEEGVVLDAGSADAGFVCGPSTCKGCCDRNRCFRGNAEELCGNSGAQCAVCGMDALCGQSNSCEALDPYRYARSDAGPAFTDAGYAQSQGRVRTCAYFATGRICW
jgi:hypothetical protein